MKFLALVLFAVASVVSSQEIALDHQQILDAASADIIDAFSEGLDEVPVPDASLQADKSELIKTLQEALRKAVEELKQRIDQGHEKLNDLIEKIAELTQRLKEHNASLGQRVKDVISRLKGKAKQYLKDILSRFGRKTVEEAFAPEEDVLREKRSLRDLIDIHIKEKAAAEKLCRIFLKMVPEVKKEEVDAYCKEHLEKFMKLINKWFGPRNSRNKRSVSEVSKAIRDFFRDIKLKYKEKYAEFAEWLRKSYKNALEKAANRHEKLRNIAIEAKKKMAEMKKQAVEELLDALRPYRAELGKLYDDLIEAAKQIFKKNVKTE